MLKTINIPTSDLYKSHYMFTDSELNTMSGYVKQGMELNTRWRLGTETKEDHKFSTALEATFKPVSTLFPDQTHITVCRHMQHEMGHVNLKGFISTSNVCLEGFGRLYKYVIHIPHDMKVGVIEIHILGKKGIYEIILPRGVAFMKTTDGFFVAVTPYSLKEKNKFNIEDNYTHLGYTPPAHTASFPAVQDSLAYKEAYKRMIANAMAGESDDFDFSDDALTD
jgi:hypothetical protein